MPEKITYRNLIDAVCQFSNKLELRELEDGTKVNRPSWEFMDRRLDFLDEEVQELKDAMDAKDEVETFDACFDVAFVAISQAYHLLRRMGFNHIEASSRTHMGFYEVATSNLKKEPPTEAGAKITKPEGWEPPTEKLKVVLYPPKKVA